MANLGNNGSGHNQVQASCTGYDFVMGELFALRQFSISAGADSLTGCVHRDAWSPGTTVAVCHKKKHVSEIEYYTLLMEGRIQSGQGKRVPSKSLSSFSSYYYEISTPCGGLDPNCTCGLYAYHDVAAMDANSYDTASFFGVIKAFGKTVVGTKGLRTEKAQIMGIAPIMKTAYYQDFLSMSTNLSDAYKRLNALRDQIYDDKKLIRKIEADLSPLPLASYIYSDHLKSVLMYTTSVMFTALIPGLIAVLAGAISVLVLLGILGAGVLSFGGWWALDEADQAMRDRKAVMSNLTIIRDRIRQNEVKLDNLSSEITRMNYNYHNFTSKRDHKPTVSHEIGRKIAAKYGVPYYKSVEKLLEAHPLSKKSDWLPESELKRLADIELQRWSTQEKLKLEKLMKQFGNLGI